MPFCARESLVGEPALCVPSPDLERRRGTGEGNLPGAIPEATLGDLRIVATLLTLAFGLKGVGASVGNLGCFEGDGGRGELVRDGGLEDVEGALYVTFTVICEESFSGAVTADMLAEPLCVWRHPWGWWG